MSRCGRPGEAAGVSRKALAVLHVVAGLDSRHGGPSRKVVALTDALAQRGDDAPPDATVRPVCV